MKVVEVEGLYKTLGKQAILRDVSFTIQIHEIVGFIGPNGAGKSTTMKCLTTLMKPDAGTIKICGHDVQTEREQALQSVSAMIENPGLFPTLSGYENLLYFAKIRNVSKKRIAEMANYTKLGAHLKKRTSQYSMGMKQRLGLAIALLHEPHFLILDEPTNGLDPSGIMELREELRDLVDHHEVSILISSHQLGEIDKIADRIICIHQGQIKETPKSLQESYVYTFLLDEDGLRRVKALAIQDVRIEWVTNGLTAYFSNDTGMHVFLETLIAHDVVIRDIVKESINIEQMYKDLYTVES